MAENKNLLMWTLVLVIVLLAGVLIYLLVIKPVVTGYAVSAQNEGINFALASVWQRAAQCQTVPLTFENRTINLVALECAQASQGQTQ